VRRPCATAMERHLVEDNRAVRLAPWAFIQHLSTHWVRLQGRAEDKATYDLPTSNYVLRAWDYEHQGAHSCERPNQHCAQGCHIYTNTIPQLDQRSHDTIAHPPCAVSTTWTAVLGS